MHKSRFAAFVIDCFVDDLEEGSAFWAGALGRAEMPAPKAWGGQYVRLDTLKHEPQMLLQRVTHPSRVHLDIETDNIPAEVERLEALGATVVNRLERWTVMEAPTGHRFCVVSPQRPDFDTAEDVNVWP